MAKRTTRKMSEETKAKMSEAMKTYFANNGYSDERKKSKAHQ